MKTSICPFLLDKKEYRELCREFLENGQQRSYTPRTRKANRIALHSFHRWMTENGHTALNEEIVKMWILECTQRRCVHAIGTQLAIIAHFTDHLISRGLWHENPFRSLRTQHHKRGYTGMARVLQKTGSIAALDELVDIPFSGVLASHFTDYLNYVSALGKSLRLKRWILKSFERYLRKHNINDLKQVDTSVVADWSNGIGQAPAFKKRHRLIELKHFFDFLLAQGRIHVSPISQLPPRDRRSLPPYIFSREEVKTILTAAEKLPDHRFMPYRGPTYRMVFLSLYTLGLRISEALNLKLADVDFVQDSITIRNTKFHKGRVLPFGPRFKAALQQYISDHPLLIKASAEDSLFPTQYYQLDRTPRLSKISCQVNFSRILNDLSITAPPGTLSPRLHSLRHSFAVHRLENWMREGVEIGAKLPLLSAFLGHIDVLSTQVYLTMTPERLALLGERFENAFGMPPKTGSEEVT